MVVPATREMDALPAALESLVASDLPRDLWELVVVDDGSADRTVRASAPVADTIVRIPGRSHGPAYARNRGAEAARGEILVFIDADVCVAPDALRRFAWAFLRTPSLAAVSGAYGDDADFRGLVSRYRDLLNHYLQTGAGGRGFWAECGAVRRDVFLAVGMFNEWHFDRPQIDAFELGQRLEDRGAQVECRPDIQARHLKEWTIGSVIEADLKDRAVPRSRLVSITNRPDHRDITGRERRCAVMVWLAVAALIAGSLGLRPALVGSGALFAGVLWLDRSILRLFRQHYGFWFTVGAVPFQVLHYLLGGVSGFVGIFLRHSIGDPQPSASIQAFSEVDVVAWPPVPRPPAPRRHPGNEISKGGPIL